MTGSFEAKKIAWRQTAKDGIVLALSIHPDDMPKEMAGSALNTRYMIAFAEIGDDEKPVAPVTQLEERSAETPEAECAGSSPAGGTTSQAEGGSTKKWSDYTRSQQAAILCNDPDFWRYTNVPGDVNNAAFIRRQLRIESRRELDTDPEAASRWDEFYALYQLHRQRLP